jgi:hypothetical protein
MTRAKHSASGRMRIAESIEECLLHDSCLIKSRRTCRFSWDPIPREAILVTVACELMGRVCATRVLFNDRGETRASPLIPHLRPPSWDESKQETRISRDVLNEPEQRNCGTTYRYVVPPRTPSRFNCANASRELRVRIFTGEIERERENVARQNRTQPTVVEFFRAPTRTNLIKHEEHGKRGAPFDSPS